MGVYVYSLRSPRRNIKVNVNGVIESVALLSFSHKPTWCFFDKEPRWQILANARIQRMNNIWERHGFPKYVCSVFIEDDGSIKWEGCRVHDWNRQAASISDGEIAYDKLKTVGFLKQKHKGVWELSKDYPNVN